MQACIDSLHTDSESIHTWIYIHSESIHTWIYWFIILPKTPWVSNQKEQKSVSRQRLCRRIRSLSLSGSLALSLSRSFVKNSRSFTFSRSLVRNSLSLTHFLWLSLALSRALSLSLTLSHFLAFSLSRSLEEEGEKNLHAWVVNGCDFLPWNDTIQKTKKSKKNMCTIKNLNTHRQRPCQYVKGTSLNRFTIYYIVNLFTSDLYVLWMYIYSTPKDWPCQGIIFKNKKRVTVPLHIK